MLLVGDTAAANKPIFNFAMGISSYYLHTLRSMLDYTIILLHYFRNVKVYFGEASN